MAWSKKTLLIIGAGASVPFGMPTAAELKRKILAPETPLSLLSECLKCDSSVENGECPSPDSQSEVSDWWKGFTHSFRNHASDSIDRFAADHKTDRAMRKLARAAVAAHLVPLEMRALGCDISNTTGTAAETVVEARRLAPIDTRLPATVVDNWHKWIINAVGPIPDVPIENLKVITFNYDRLFEIAIMMHLVDGLGCRFHEAIKTVLGMEIVHVHGDLGYDLYSLERNRWISSVGAVPGDAVRMAVRNLRLMPDERNGEGGPLSQARAHVKWADRIIALGFGFDLEPLTE